MNSRSGGIRYPKPSRKSRCSRRATYGARTQPRIPFQFASYDIPLSGNAGIEISNRGETRYAYCTRSIRAGLFGDNRWYETNVPIADRLFERHLRAIQAGEDHG